MRRLDRTPLRQGIQRNKQIVIKFRQKIQANAIQKKTSKCSNRTLLRQGIQRNKQIVIKFFKKYKQMQYRKKRVNAQIGLYSDREYRETSK